VGSEIKRRRFIKMIAGAAAASLWRFASLARDT
jgi:hypothetical protein